MPLKNKDKKTATPVESTRHKDKRKNIPKAGSQVRAGDIINIEMGQE